MTVPGVSSLSLETCEIFRRHKAAGGDDIEIVTALAARYNVNRPAIWKRLRTGGVLPPYRANTGIRRIRKSASSAEQRIDKDAQPRVSRDPCPRCGARGDIDCGHSKVRLGLVLSNG